MRKYFISIILFLISLSVTLQCSCHSIPQPLEELENPDIAMIFVGTVLEVSNDARDIVANFKVKNVVKGDKKDNIEVRTKASQAECGFPFKKGVTYLVYASKVNGAFIASECSRTNLLSDAKSDIRDLKITNI